MTTNGARRGTDVPAEAKAPTVDVSHESHVSAEVESEHAGHHGMPGYHDSKDAQLKRLRRIEGQVRGLQRQVENDTYCIDVLTQVSAATRALEAFALGLLDEHLAHCVAQAVSAGGPGSAEADAKIKEASAAIARLVRS
jgi:DNA-binding FrmR family transcriptional regulator